MQQITKNVFTETEIRGCNPSIVFTSEGAVFIEKQEKEIKKRSDK